MAWLLADDVHFFLLFLSYFSLSVFSLTLSYCKPLLFSSLLFSSLLFSSLLFSSLLLLTGWQLKQHALLWLVKRNQVRCFCEVWSPSTSYCAVNSVSRHQRGMKDTLALWRDAVTFEVLVWC
ncbi:hypothetical protein LDENG_00240910 [Lucifuga dentata]|nr:hypothetical protein LDENG_00240910 [Lucifuga dentata]